MMKGTEKRVKSIFLAFAIAAALTGCGQTDGNASKSGTGVYSTSKTVNDVLEEQAGSDETAQDSNSTEASDIADKDDTQKAMETVNEKLDDAKEQAEAAAGEDVDVDLTKLTSTMVYSEVYNMVTEPSNYMGKTVRMKGITSIYHDDVDNNDYYACVIQDATACCAQGIEFVLNNGDYPVANTEVTVVGTFSSYKIQDYEYFTLKDAVVESVQ